MMLDISPLNAEYDEAAVLRAVGAALTEFYASLTQKLNALSLDDVLKRKNTYL